MEGSESQNLDPRLNGYRVAALLQGAAEVVIIAPFVTRAGLTPVLDVLPDDASVTLYTRWRADEVATGVSDPGVLELLGKRGVIFLNPMLHAKAYIRSGSEALVGSSNTTSTGLGWRNQSGIELLVDVAGDHPALLSLIDFLDATSVTATPEIAECILAQAKEFNVVLPTETVAEPVATSATWLPIYGYPQALWYIYQGKRDEQVTRLARQDLQALQPPPGLTESQFRAYVGSILLQGFPGRVAENLSNQGSYRAVRELSRLAESVDLQLDDPEGAWNTLAAWMGHFLPNYYSVGHGGRKLFS